MGIIPARMFVRFMFVYVKGVGVGVGVGGASFSAGAVNSRLTSLNDL